MFNRFTQEARRTVTEAQREARALGHQHIGTEHLLLGVATGEGRASEALAGYGITAERLRAAIREDDGPGLDAGALATLGIDLDEIRRRAEASFGPGALERGRRRRGRGMPFCPATKKALELALREAIRLGDRHVGAEHVLLGLVRDERTRAVALLRTCEVPIPALREALTPAGRER